MNQDLDIFQLVAHASLVVQSVLVLLVLISVMSWAAIFRKLINLHRIKQQNDAFTKEFWAGSSLEELYNTAQQRSQNSGPMERIFASGMREVRKEMRERRVAEVEHHACFFTPPPWAPRASAYGAGRRRRRR